MAEIKLDTNELIISSSISFNEGCNIPNLIGDMFAKWIDKEILEIDMHKRCRGRKNKGEEYVYL